MTRIGYLTSLYARASDSFVRGEVAALRAAGKDVRTYSIRRPPAAEVVTTEVAQEQSRTYYLLEQPILGLAGACLAQVCASPVRALQALSLAARVSTPGLRGRLLGMAYLLESLALARRLRADGITHLHNHMGFNSAAVAMLASHLAGIGYSLTIHGPDEFDAPMAIALGEKVSRATFTVAIAEFGRSQILRWVDPDIWSRVVVVRCGVGSAFLNSPRTPVPDAPRFVAVGRLVPAKGFELLIEAAARLRSAGRRFELVIIGDGPSRPGLEAACVRWSLSDVVRFRGWSGAAEIREEILRSRALLLPSFAEGLPVVLMEALALGRPVVATAIAGIPELVQDGRTGWLVPAGSVEGFASAMNAVLSADGAHLDQLAAAGRELVTRNHDQEAQAELLVELFEQRCARVDGAIARGHGPARAK